MGRSTSRIPQLLSIAVGYAALAGCEGRQSALAPAGQEAQEIARLFWWMAGGAAVIWLFMVGMAVYAIWFSPRAHDHRRTRIFIVGGGAVIPTLILTVLLVFGLRLLPQLLAPAPAGSLRVQVEGLQWWWRVRYLSNEDPKEKEIVELANEVRLPVNEPVQFLLNSGDVIHSFWIPSLGGKVDMMPGRQTRLTLTPNRTGTFRGVCAEYCGEAHAQMAFDVIVMERTAFDEWLDQQRQPAHAPSRGMASQGKQVFEARGCGACHTVRGTEARGVIGPDLTHVGSRSSVGAGILSNTEMDFRKWIAETDRVKPGVLMPSFHMLPDTEQRALSAWLEELQ